MLSETYAKLVHKVLHCDKNVPFLFINPLSGRLISLGDAAAFALVCLSLCFQPRIKMPNSAGYHGASSLLSAHFNPTDFSSRCFVSVAFFSSHSLSPRPPILISCFGENINPLL